MADADDKDDKDEDDKGPGPDEDGEARAARLRELDAKLAELKALRAEQTAAYADARLDNIRALFNESLDALRALGDAEVVVVVRLCYPNDPEKTLALDVFAAAHCDKCVNTILEAGTRLARSMASEVVEVDVAPPTHVEPEAAPADDLPKTPTGETLQ